MVQNMRISARSISCIKNVDKRRSECRSTAVDKASKKLHMHEQNLNALEVLLHHQDWGPKHKHASDENTQEIPRARIVRMHVFVKGWPFPASTRSKWGWWNLHQKKGLNRPVFLFSGRIAKPVSGLVHRVRLHI